MRKGVGFQVVTEALLVDDGSASLEVVNEQGLRSDMSELFLKVIRDHLPEFAEARGYRVEDVQLGVNIFLLDPEEISQDPEPEDDE